MTFRKGQSVWKAALLRRTPSPLPLRLFTCLSPPLILSLWNLTRTHSCSSTETDSILLKPECLCVRSQPSHSPLTFFPFNTQMFFLLFFFFFLLHPVLTLKCGPEWTWLAGPPRRLSCHHRSYFWALNRLSPSDPITRQARATCRVKTAALRSF